MKTRILVLLACAIAPLAGTGLARASSSMGRVSPDVVALPSPSVVLGDASGEESRAALPRCGGEVLLQSGIGEATLSFHNLRSCRKIVVRYADGTRQVIRLEASSGSSAAYSGSLSIPSGSDLANFVLIPSSGGRSPRIGRISDVIRIR